VVRCLSIATVVMLLVSACQSVSETPPAQPLVSSLQLAAGPAPRLPGQIIFAPGDGSLWLMSANGANIHALLKRNNDVFVQEPVLAPDGQRVAYSAKTYTDLGEPIQDVRLVDVRDGSSRVVVSSTVAGTLFSSPAWSVKGQELVVTRTRVNTPGSEHSDLVRASLDGGSLHTVIEDGQNASLSPDGKKMVFLRVDAQSLAASLWIAQPDGSGAIELLDKSVFAGLQGARFSPDSQTIVFAASGAPRVPLPGVQSRLEGDSVIAASTRSDNCLWRALFACWAQIAHAHGLPWNLWLVKPDGTSFERLTEAALDSPYPAWSPDGKFIAFMDLTGIYVVDRQQRTAYRVSTRIGHGSLDWK
jgi:Tol biopolymer transport system component